MSHAIATLSDRDLLDAVARAAADERRATVGLLRLLAELDGRRLYLGEGCSSLFTYCTQVLRLSEHAAYHRIEAARAARQFPIVLKLLGEGALTLTTIALLRRHLTSENYEDLLVGARHKTKREVEYQIACLTPRPDAKALVRRVHASAQASPGPGLLSCEATHAPDPAPESDAQRPAEHLPRSVIRPTAPERYLMRLTLSAETHAKLRRAEDLLRHTIPNGDHAAILDRALTLLVEQLERQKIGRMRRGKSPGRFSDGSKEPVRSRHIPAAVRREVWARDQGRCAFVGPRGRCRETGRLEFHHLAPFSRGGPMTVANLSLRCRAHNAFEGELVFGPRTLNGS